MKPTTYYLYPFILVCLLGIPGIVFSSTIDDVSYSSIKEVRESDVLLEHNGPSVEQFSRCSISSGECTQVDKDTSLYPAILGDHTYETGPNGDTAVYTIKLADKSLHFLYTIDSGDPVLRRVLPFTDHTTRLRFSNNGSYLLAATVSGDLIRYTIADNTVERMTTTQRTFPFFQVSPRGTYVSAYNYSFGEHRLWNLDNKTLTSIDATEPAFVEFNDTEDEVVFVTQGQDGHTTLTTAPLPYSSDTAEKELTRGTTVRDYLYVGNDLYLIDNNNGFYSYDLFRISTNGDRTLVAENVSYGQYIREIDGKLLFLSHNDAQTVVTAYNPEAETLTELTHTTTPSALDTISRTAVEYNGRNAVLWEPEEGNTTNTLFVWLHGGPKRQTSLSFHPYLSYAVYDAVLIELVESGASVLRLDYTGSEGYSAQDQERLVGNIGKVEVNDIVKATQSQASRDNIDKVHLIGNSYGGYLALRAITEEPDLFDSAISINGVTNWYTLLTAIPDSLFARYFNGAPDLHNLEQYFSASVFSGLPEVPDNTPILLFYGENDSTIPSAQSIDYHAYARTLGKNTTLVELPNESHILREDSSLQKLCGVIAEELNLQRVQCN
ncbi:MAG: alpha/beta fold hydrolase [Candidatus Paceibacterota bacterium]